MQPLAGDRRHRASLVTVRRFPGSAIPKFPKVTLLKTDNLIIVDS